MGLQFLETPTWTEGIWDSHNNPEAQGLRDVRNVNFMDSWAILRVHTGFYLGTISWPYLYIGSISFCLTRKC